MASPINICASVTIFYINSMIFNDNDEEKILYSENDTMTMISTMMLMMMITTMMLIMILMISTLILIMMKKPTGRLRS